MVILGPFLEGLEMVKSYLVHNHQGEGTKYGVVAKVV